MDATERGSWCYLTTQKAVQQGTYAISRQPYPGILHLLRSSETRQFSALIIRRTGWQKSVFWPGLQLSVGTCSCQGPSLVPSPPSYPQIQRFFFKCIDFLLHISGFPNFHVPLVPKPSAANILQAHWPRASQDSNERGPTHV